MRDYYKKNEFKEWLKNDTLRWNNPKSVSSYTSGVGYIIDLIDNEAGHQINFTYLKEIDNQNDRDTFFSAVLNIIQTKLSKNPSMKSTLQNYKSYLNAFEKFYESEPFSGKGLSDAKKRKLKRLSSCATYTNDELIKEFMGRILTQDRISMSKDVMFPIRLIWKLWKTEVEEWAKHICDNIWIIVREKRDTTFQDVYEKQVINIETLSIGKDGKVIVRITNDENDYIMCTSYSDPYEYLEVENDKIQYVRKRTSVLSKKLPQGGYIVDKNKNVVTKGGIKIIWHVRDAKVKNIGDIAIDHDIPISQVLIDKAKELKDLKILSDEYRRLSGIYNIKVSAKYANNFCKKFKSEDFKKISFLKKDLEVIGKCKLVLMGKDENSQKSDS